MHFPLSICKSACPQPIRKKTHFSTRYSRCRAHHCGGRVRRAIITKASDVTPKPSTYSLIGSRLFDFGEEALLTSTDGSIVPLGSPTCDCIVNMARSRLYVHRPSIV